MKKEKVRKSFVVATKVVLVGLLIISFSVIAYRYINGSVYDEHIGKQEVTQPENQTFQDKTLLTAQFTILFITLSIAPFFFREFSLQTKNWAIIPESCVKDSKIHEASNTISHLHTEGQQLEVGRRISVCVCVSTFSLIVIIGMFVHGVVFVSVSFAFILFALVFTLVATFFALFLSCLVVGVIRSFQNFADAVANLLISILILLGFIEGSKEESKIATHWYLQAKLLYISRLFFSARAQKTLFRPIVAEWDEEIYLALQKSPQANLFMIHLRNSYGFIAAMWLKSPIGDLIEYVSKLAK